MSGAVISEIKHILTLLRNLRSNPNLGSDLQKSSLFKFVTKLLPHKVLRHYLYSMLVGRNATPYNSREFFESYYSSALDGEFSDGATVRPDYDPLTVRYHYSVTEKSLIECLVKHKPRVNCSVLDIGSGAGHWIDFYLEVMRASSVTGIDIAPSSVIALKEKYKDEPKVRILEGDVSRHDFNLGEKFDIINAIGVMFHIVDDNLWKGAIKNLARHLKDDGIVIVGGQFGWVTRNVQFHATDKFENWDELMGNRSDLALIQKRIKSLRLWKKAAEEAGLRVAAIRRTKEAGYIYTPENNILILSQSNCSNK